MRAEGGSKGRGDQAPHEVRVFSSLQYDALALLLLLLRTLVRLFDLVLFSYLAHEFEEANLIVDLQSRTRLEERTIIPLRGEGGTFARLHLTLGGKIALVADEDTEEREKHNTDSNEVSANHRSHPVNRGDDPQESCMHMV
jgi:hypothetical protein